MPDRNMHALATVSNLIKHGQMAASAATRYLRLGSQVELTPVDQVSEAPVELSADSIEWVLCTCCIILLTPRHLCQHSLYMFIDCNLFIFIAQHIPVENCIYQTYFRRSSLLPKNRQCDQPSGCQMILQVCG